MEDLLREDDFLIKDGNYNPSKYFRKFYWGAFIHFIFAFIVIAQLSGNAFVILSLIISPMLMAFGMVFLNKRIAELSVKTILTSVCFLLGIYYGLMIVVVFIADVPLDEILIMTLGFVLCFLFCSAVVVPIVKRKKKKNKISY